MVLHTTTLDSETLDGIVREVVRRLSAAAECDADGPAATRAGTLVITDRVVSMAVLDNRLAGAARLEVPADAVVTPAVHDELRARHIPLIRAGERCVTPATDASRQGAAPGALHIAVAMADSDTVRWESLLRPLAGTAGWETFPCTDAAVDRACRAAVDDQRAALLTDRVAAAVCRANRDPEVRAACGWDHGALREAIDTLAINLLIVDPRRHTPSEARALLRTYSEQYQK